MSTQHTPGPWNIGKEFKEKCGDFKLYGRPISGSGKAIARVWSGSERRLFEQPEDEVNARLIAAAPDLLAALRLFVGQWNACGPNSDFGRYFANVRDAALTAIAKVEPKS